MSEPTLSIRNLSFSYRPGQPVLSDVNLDVFARDFASVVGPNGGGKTTLLRLMLGLLRPDTGSIRVFGGAPRAARARVSYVPQHARFDARFPAHALDVVLLGRLGKTRAFGGYRRADRDAAHRALEEVGMLALAHRPFASLSGGQLQRVLIARALCSEPDLLLLDEPTASLDPTVERELYELLTVLNQRLTLLLVSHDLGFVSQYVKSVICVNRRVVMHPTTELTGEMVREIYGSEVSMVRHDHHHVCGTGDDA